MPEEPGFRLRLRRAVTFLDRKARRAIRGPRTTSVEQRVQQYRGYWSGAAARLSAEFVDVTREVWEVRRDGRRTRIASHVTEADGPVTLELAGDKAYCIDVARGQGLPVPTLGVYSLARLREAMDRLTEPPGSFVVRPRSGTSAGSGVTTDVTTRAGLERAAVLASLFDPEFLLGRMVALESCRLLYLDGEMIHAVRRRGLRVKGDGRSTFRELMVRGGWGRLWDDRCTRLTLAYRGAGPDDVPPEGVEALVRFLPPGEGISPELRTVYNETITPLVGDALREEAARVVRVLGCRLAGIDVLTDDPGAGLAERGGVFLEINTTPGIHHHYQSDADKTDHPVATRVLDYLLRSRSDAAADGEVRTGAARRGTVQGGAGP